MAGISDVKPHDPKKPKRLYNVACPYCGVSFTKELTRTKDHVIARNFVPPGHFDGQWNLIVNACQRCNGEKSQLENEVAAISMQPDAWGVHPSDDAQLASEAPRRAQSVKNSRTGKPIHVPESPIVVEVQPIPGLALKMSFTSGAQLSESHALRLAWYHITAFFYLITYRPDEKLGRRWAGEFIPLALVRESDWGNSLMRSFQDLVEPWGHRFRGTAASGYFRACIKKSPDTRDLWSWALEWNRTFRVIGFIGSEEAAREAARVLVWPRQQILKKGPNETESFRIEERLPVAEDKLFRMPPESEG